MQNSCFRKWLKFQNQNFVTPWTVIKTRSHLSLEKLFILAMRMRSPLSRFILFVHWISKKVVGSSFQQQSLYVFIQKGNMSNQFFYHSRSRCSLSENHKSNKKKSASNPKKKVNERRASWIVLYTVRGI